MSTHFQWHRHTKDVDLDIPDTNPQRLSGIPGAARVFGHDDVKTIDCSEGTLYGMTTGDVFLATTHYEYRLGDRSFFVVNGRQTPSVLVSGPCLMIYLKGYFGLAQVGGPLETRGRLRYIDGCSDSLLVSPPVKGEPCLNHLHIPAGTNQTQHVHPSDRIGIIVGGRGRCVTPDGTFELATGMFWRIPTGGAHSFHTDDVALDVIAWHPESDFGPTLEDHPMMNKTIVEGRPANDAQNVAIHSDAAAVIAPFGA